MQVRSVVVEVSLYQIWYSSDVCTGPNFFFLLPVCANKQGEVIGLVSVYIYIFVT